MTDEKPATIGEQVALATQYGWDADDPQRALKRLRDPEWRSVACWHHLFDLAAKTDALISEHVAKKDAAIAAAQESEKEARASEQRAWAETGRANKWAEEKAARIKEFEDWARAMCKAECEPYRKIGRHAPNCPCADLGIEPEET